MPNPRSWQLMRVFSSKGSTVVTPTLRSLIQFELSFIYEVRVQLHSFAFGYLILPAPFVQNTTISLDILAKHRHTGLFLDSQFFWSTFYAYISFDCCFDYCCFEVLKVGGVSPPTLLFFSKIVLPFLGSLQLHMNFKSACQFLQSQLGLRWTCSNLKVLPS